MSDVIAHCPYEGFAGGRAFGTPRFRVLYRAWTEQGDRVLDAVVSPTLATAIARQTGKFDARTLARRYLHLAPLAGTCTVKKLDPAHAAPSYSRKSPPRRSRRFTVVGCVLSQVLIGGRPFGGRRPRLR